MSPLTTHHDVVVIGARCAGASTAMLLARAGHDVTVIDKARLPRDTLSTHGLARGGVVQLKRWGLLEPVLASGAPAVRQVRFATAEGSTVRTVKDRAGVDHLLAPRRYALDAILAEAATAAGATLRTGVGATGLLRDERGHVRGVRVRAADGSVQDLNARFVVGADGVHSRTARWAEASVLAAGAPGGATFYTYVDQADWPAYEFHIGPRSLAGAFPTHDGAACVYLCGPPAITNELHAAGDQRAAAFSALLRRVAPELAATVDAGRILTPVRGASGLPNHVRQAHGPGWALVGDAGYHRDPVTGHGITDAFRDAEFLATALDAALSGTEPADLALAGYQDRRNAALHQTFELTKALSRYPGAAEFIALQKQLSGALDLEAEMLAGLDRELVPA